MNSIIKLWKNFLKLLYITLYIFILGRVICTCYAGYRFNQELHRQSAQSSSESFNLGLSSNSMNVTNQTEPVGVVNACEDIDECMSGKADCEHVSQHFYTFSLAYVLCSLSLCIILLNHYLLRRKYIIIYIDIF